MKKKLKSSIQIQHFIKMNLNAKQNEKKLRLCSKEMNYAKHAHTFRTGTQ